MKVHTFSLFAEYRQFYLQDESTPGDLSEAWSPAASSRMLAVAPGVVGVGTARNLDVPVRVSVEHAPPPLDVTKWDHVVECDLAAPSGRIVIAGCTDYFPDAARIEVCPGDYRVRVCMSGLQTIDDSRMEGDDEYHIFLWPAASQGVGIIKQVVDPRGEAPAP